MQFLLFGALQYGSTLYNFSSLLTRRAAIILDDTPTAWGDLENSLLLYIPKELEFKTWASSPKENTSLFHMFMNAFAEHGAEVEETPVRVSASQKYRLVPTKHSALYCVSEKLTTLHDKATRQSVFVRLGSKTKTGEWVHPHPHGPLAKHPRLPPLLDVLLPLIRMHYNDHVIALEREKCKVELANARIEQLKRRVKVLEGKKA